jgi:hypothetical protein
MKTHALSLLMMLSCLLAACGNTESDEPHEPGSGCLVIDLASQKLPAALVYQATCVKKHAKSPTCEADAKTCAQAYFDAKSSPKVCQEQIINNCTATTDEEFTNCVSRYAEDRSNSLELTTCAGLRDPDTVALIEVLSKIPLECQNIQENCPAILGFISPYEEYNPP